MNESFELENGVIQTVNIVIAERVKTTSFYGS